MAKVFKTEVAVPNGTSEDPSYTFDGDRDTGMFRSVSDSLGLSAGGNVNLFVDANGVRIYNQLRVLFGDLRVEENDIIVDDGFEDLDVLLDRPTRVLYVGRPGTVAVTTPSAAIVDRYRPASGVLAVITNITMTFPAAGGNPLIVALKPNSSAATYLSYLKYVKANSTVSIDTFIPMGSTDCICAGEVLSNTVDFQSTATLTVSGIEIR